MKPWRIYFIWVAKRKEEYKLLVHIVVKITQRKMTSKLNHA